jgi:hypothetical protein
LWVIYSIELSISLQAIGRKVQAIWRKGHREREKKKKKNISYVRPMWKCIIVITQWAFFNGILQPPLSTLPKRKKNFIKKIKLN